MHTYSLFEYVCMFFSHDSLAVSFLIGESRGGGSHGALPVRSDRFPVFLR